MVQYMRLTTVYGAVYDAYLGLCSCKRGLPWFMELYTRLIMVNGVVYEAYHGPWSCMRLTMVNGAVYEAYL